MLISLKVHNIGANDIWVIRATYWGTNRKPGSDTPPEFVVQFVIRLGFVPEAR